MSQGVYLSKEKIKRIKDIYGSTDLDYEDISERFGIPMKEARKYCNNVKKVFKNVTPNPRIEHSFYTPEELEIYRAFQSREPDAFENLTIDLCSSL